MDDRKQDSSRELPRFSPKGEKDKNKKSHPSIAELSEPVQPAAFQYRNSNLEASRGSLIQSSRQAIQPVPQYSPHQNFSQNFSITNYNQQAQTANEMKLEKSLQSAFDQINELRTKNEELKHEVIYATSECQKMSSLFEEFKSYVTTQIKELREENAELKTLTSFKKANSSEKNNSKLNKDLQGKKLSMDKGYKRASVASLQPPAKAGSSTNQN